VRLARPGLAMRASADSRSAAPRQGGRPRHRGLLIPMARRHRRQASAGAWAVAGGADNL